MPSSLQILALVASCVAGAWAASDEYDFGNTFYLGPTSSSSNYIASITYDLDDVPAVPSGYTAGTSSDPIFVSPWVGISSSISDQTTTLVQPLLNWSPDQESQGCAGTVDQWCVAASTYMPASSNSQVGQAYVVVPSAAKLSFSITTTAEGVATQKVWQNGELVSQQTDTMNALPSYAYGTTECFTGSGGACGSVGTYTWTNMTIKLAEADSSFGDTLYNEGTTGSITTSDEGKTWTGSFKMGAESF
ncbi:hypothetical protein N0V93_002494 [Gnomoniopsis smithogilvyi]|uniref:Uncharacterized protein n=1 Tax=Gnomoniopsis smithogilvyi TaxID=1191159 RepID=A0A9W8YWV0_9PEZI|nr:hypothetical protein N0V93_002494 [Gnomoniopsis smithogilvyi]